MSMGIILRGIEGHKDYWKGLRTVGIAGFHHLDLYKRVEFLYQVFIRNMQKDGVENYLYVLHPGNVSSKILDSWPTPHHPDEPTLPLAFNPPEYEYKQSLLDMIYSKRFNQEGDKVIWKDELVEWDSWVSKTFPGGMLPEEAVIWPRDGTHTQENGNYINKEYPIKSGDNFVPFTVFKLGPFTKKGPTLITFGLTIEGATYDELVASCPVFSIDGPETILLTTKRKSHERFKDQETWKKELDKFDKHYLDSMCYDIILVNNQEKVGQVKVIYECGIGKAPHQPPEPLDKIAERYISTFPRFNLSLKYLNEKITKELTEKAKEREEKILV